MWYNQRRGERQIMGKVDKENRTVVTTTMSKAYQITVPSVVRRALGLMPGDPVEFRMERGRAVLVRAETREEKIKRVFAELDRMKVEREKQMTSEQKEFAKMSAGWTINQYHEYYDNLPETKAYIKEKYGV